MKFPFFKSAIDQVFTIKGLGEGWFFFSLEVYQRESFLLNQKKYDLNILTYADLLGAKPSRVPFPLGLQLDNTSSSVLIDLRLHGKIIVRLLS